MSSTSRPSSRSSSRKSRKRRSRTSSCLGANMEDSGIVNVQPEGGCKSLRVSSKDGVVADSKDLLSLSPLSPEDIPLPLSPSSKNDDRPLRNSLELDVNDEYRKTKEISKHNFKGTDNDIHRVRIEPERTGWARIYDLVRQFDKDRVIDVKEDIDTLLVFAGLFSAIITAFIIESYKNLQQQPEDLTNHILMQLATQISHLTVNGNFVNSTVPDFTTPSFQKSRVAVVINTLWISSLLIALITASIGILVKQWFHELLSYETHDPMERLKLRFFREAGVERWKVFAIASSLPLLLQLALLLFFVGLALFFHQLDAIVAWFTTGISILWLGSLVFTTLTPTFSSQCPYKTPFLKGIITQIRIKYISLSWLEQFCYWLYIITPEHRFPRFSGWFWKSYYHFWRIHRDWQSLEEESVCQDGLLSLPVISYARDLLQGERLQDPIEECIRSIPDDDIKKADEEIRLQSSPIHRMLPYIPGGLARNVGSFLIEAIRDPHLQPANFGQEVHPCLFLALTRLQSSGYTPNHDIISSRPLSVFIRLIQADSSSAAFSFLSMYSIRQRTLTEHPDSFDFLFLAFSDPVIHSHGIGDEFLSNLLSGIECLIVSIWNQTQVEPDGRRVGEFIEAIRVNADQSDPLCSPDPVAFIYVLASVLHGLIPFGVVQRRKDEINEVIGEIPWINAAEDMSSWTYSRQRCVVWTWEYLRALGLAELTLRPKIRRLIGTWDPEYCNWFSPPSAAGLDPR